MNKDINWVFQLLGQLYAERAALVEQVAALRQELAALNLSPINDARNDKE